MINLDSARNEMAAAGLLVEQLTVDGVVRRCRIVDDREQRGWYCLHEWRASNGNTYVVGSYGIWRGNDNGARKIQIGAQEKIDPAELAALRKRLADDKKRAIAKRAQEADAAACRAAAVWHKALTTAPVDIAVDYLSRKSIQSYGLRYTSSGALVIPMMDADRNVRGLQFILPSHHPRRKKTGRDKEYWPPGMAKQGHWYLIGSPRASGICLVVEGYATGATLHAATGLPVAVAFDAGNLRHVAAAIKKAYALHRILICADDDYLTDGNPGSAAAAIAALEVGGAWLQPVFPGDRNGKKLTDFNDLQHFPGGGLALVSQQIETKLMQLKWQGINFRAANSTGGVGGDSRMPARLSIEEAAERYWGTYGLGGDVLFDEVERRLVHKKDVLNLLPRHGWELLKDKWRMALDSEIGFDPTEKDPAIKCNLFGGWPTTPKAGKCQALLDLLLHLCSNEPNRDGVYQWILKWMAYPLQHRGGKMHSAIVMHGPQGTGKSRLWEAYCHIYGSYGRVLGQEALEDKFNADWAEKKLFIIGDEVLARGDMYHIKNRLKGFITGEMIRVNPKNIAAHNEKNQMNIVFLSNELMPLVLENDDRRHLVVRVPPKLSDAFFAQINAEINDGGVAALHHYLLNLDLGDFKPWSRPPMTAAKEHLIDLGISSEERFLRDWMNLEVEIGGAQVPFHPCLGSTLYERVYKPWCQKTGANDRRLAGLLGYLRTRPGWRAATSVNTFVTVNSTKRKNRKMVIPPMTALDDCRKEHEQYLLPDEIDRIFGPEFRQAAGQTQQEWLTECFFAFERAIGAAQ